MNASQNDSRMEIVDHIDGRPVTRFELTEAFDWVCDRSNWKNPINCTVYLSPRQIKLVRHAVAFFVGAFPTITFATTDGTAKVRVVSPGYYAICGA